MPSPYTLVIDLDHVYNGLLLLSGSVAVLYSWLKLRSILRRSSMRDMPGPPVGGLMWGSSVEKADFDVPRLQSDWVKRYGRVFKYFTLFRVIYP